MGRGGYQKPAGPRPPSGVGKNSTRTDGNVQAVKVPNVGSSPDLQYGDRQKLEAAQRAAPIGRPGAPRPAGPAQGMVGEPAGAQANALPPWLIDMPSNRPAEAITTGLDTGPGAGSEVLSNRIGPVDEREAILEALYAIYGNQDALADLQAFRSERASQALPPSPAAPLAPQTAPPE